MACFFGNTFAGVLHLGESAAQVLRASAAAGGADSLPEVASTGAYQGNVGASDAMTALSLATSAEAATANDGTTGVSPW